MGVATVGVALRDGAAPVGAGRRPDRRCGHGADTGGRPDVPVQQPRRAAGAAAWSARRLRDGPRRSETASTSGCCSPACCVGFGFLTKMLQALLVVPAFALAYLLAAPTAVRRRIVQLLGAPARHRRRRPAGGSRSSSSCPAARPPVHRRLAEQQRARPRPSATTASAGSPATRPAASVAVAAGRRRRWGATGLGAAVRRRRSAARSPGCMPAALAAARRRAAGCAAARRAPTRARGLPALGRLAARHRAGLQLHGRASSTPTTRWRWRRRSARSSASAASCSGSAAPRRGARLPRGRGRRGGRWSWLLLGRAADWTAVAAVRRALVGARRRARARWPRGVGGTVTAVAAARRWSRRSPAPAALRPPDRVHRAHRVDRDRRPPVAGANGGGFGPGRGGQASGRPARAASAGRGRTGGFRGAPPRTAHPARARRRVRATTGGLGQRGGGGMGGLLEASTVERRARGRARRPTRTPTRWVAATVGANNAAGYQLATRTR